MLLIKTKRCFACVVIIVLTLTLFTYFNFMQKQNGSDRGYVYNSKFKINTYLIRFYNSRLLPTMNNVLESINVTGNIGVVGDTKLLPLLLPYLIA